MQVQKINSDYLYFLTRLFILIILLLTVLNINKIFANTKVLGVTIDTTSVQEQKEYWLKIVAANPTYIDGYVELSRIENFLGNKEVSVQYLQKARALDPNRTIQ